MITLTKLFIDFFESKKAAGVVLLLSAAFSMWLANIGPESPYSSFWELNIVGHTIVHWVNDGLMSIFFLLIGLELERELYIGELSDIKNALLPIFAAIGGMLLPACIHFVLNYGQESQAGAGIPMATDIAFALGVLSLFGKRVPAVLKVFLAALAVIDDLGAMITIAIFYSKGISLTNLGIALGIFLILGLLNFLKVRKILPYLIGGVAMWYFMQLSGVHATISGVLLAFAVPFGTGDEQSTSYRLQKALNKPVSFIILPIFALANTAIPFTKSIIDSIISNNSIGIFLGLFIGKPIGIFLFSFSATALGICRKPRELNWQLVLGAGLLGGIGFTMSIFITLLAFDNTILINSSKVTIILSSVIAAVTGFAYLAFFLPKTKTLPNSHSKQS